MRRPEELDSMLRHAQNQAQQAQLQWSRAREQLAAAQARLEELCAYALEYADAGRMAGHISDLCNQQAFNARLQQACTQQEQVCAQAQQKLTLAWAQWQDRQNNASALEHLKQQRQMRLDEDRQRMEQRALDDFALRSLNRSG